MKLDFERKSFAPRQMFGAESTLQGGAIAKYSTSSLMGVPVVLGLFF